MEPPSVPDVPEVPEVPEVPSEPVVIKKRGRPKGSLNRKAIEKMKAEREPSPALDPKDLGLDVDFTSDEVLGAATPPAPKRKARPKAPPTQPPSESEDEPAPPPPSPQPPPRRRSVSGREGRAPRRSEKRSVQPEPEQLNPPSYLEVLQRGLKEARAKQYAEKVAQYDRFFQW